MEHVSYELVLSRPYPDAKINAFVRRHVSFGQTKPRASDASPDSLSDLVEWLYGLGLQLPAPINLGAVSDMPTSVLLEQMYK
jgi:hypothetical protein